MPSSADLGRRGPAGAPFRWARVSVPCGGLLGWGVGWAGGLGPWAPRGAAPGLRAQASAAARPARVPQASGAARWRAGGAARRLPGSKGHKEKPLRPGRPRRGRRGRSNSPPCAWDSGGRARKGRAARSARDVGVKIAAGSGARVPRIGAARALRTILKIFYWKRRNLTKQKRGAHSAPGHAAPPARARRL